MRRLPTGATLERLTVGSPPGFVWEIADSPLKQRVASIVGPRRLLRVGEATIQLAPYRVLNADDKTVARLLGTKVWAGPFDKLRTSPDAGAALLNSRVRAVRSPRLFRAVPAPGPEIQRSWPGCLPMARDVRTDPGCGGQAARILLGQARLSAPTRHACRRGHEGNSPPHVGGHAGKRGGYQGGLGCRISA